MITWLPSTAADRVRARLRSAGLGVAVASKGLPMHDPVDFGPVLADPNLTITEPSAIRAEPILPFQAHDGLRQAARIFASAGCGAPIIRP
jgi:hypothetical protein